MKRKQTLKVGDWVRLKHHPDVQVAQVYDDGTGEVLLSQPLDNYFHWASRDLVKVPAPKKAAKAKP